MNKNDIIIQVTNIKWDVDNKSDLKYLPPSLKIPLEKIPKICDMDSLSDYISDITGFCHDGFSFECNVTTDDLYKEIDEIDDELIEEYKDGETCWAANLECLRAELESLICLLEENEIGIERE